jgi:hypothetical protein
MTKIRFENLLEELGKALNIPGLKPDNNNCCLIKLNNGVELHLEIDLNSDRLFVGADLGAIPLGKYRENLFKTALKANGTPHPRYGVFALSKPSEHLVMHETLPFEELNGKKLTEFITFFSDKAFKWQEALSKSEIPLLSSTSRVGGGMFGLAP